MLKYGAKEVMNFTLYGLAGDLKDKPVLYFDTLKTSEVDIKAAQAEAKGGQGNAKQLMWDHSKEAMIKATDCLTSMKALAILNGSKVVKGVANIFKNEFLVVASKKVTVAMTPIADVVLMDADGNLLASTTTGKDVTITGTVTDGTVVQAFYKYASTADAQTISVKTDSFPGFYRGVGDTVITNQDTGQVELFQVVFHKIKLKPNYKLDFRADGEPTTFDFEFELFASNGKDFLDMVKYV